VSLDEIGVGLNSLKLGQESAHVGNDLSLVAEIHIVIDVRD
jgi:hypothetical protein